MTKAMTVAGAAAGGVAVALSLPPWGLWWLAPVGYAAFALALGSCGRARQRAGAGAAFGLGCFGVGLAWMAEFTVPGTVLVVLMTAAMSAAGATLVRRGAVASAGAVGFPAAVTATLGFPAAVTLTEALRYRVPFGGLPLAGPALGQVDGPLVTVARVGGDLAVVFVAALTGAAIAALIHSCDRWVKRLHPAVTRMDWAGSFGVAAVAVAVAVAIVVGAGMAPEGRRTGALRVAYVQGGGARGLRASNNDAAAVYDRHLDASTALREGIDLVLWPEDVIDIANPIDVDPVRDEISALARRLEATVVVGVVEDEGETRFRNAAVAFDKGGNIADRYDKVHRVPFGEYVPFRSLIERLADLSDVPRDAIPGRGPGVLLTRSGAIGVLVSYEVFFAERAEAAVRAGAELIVVPTNAASFYGRQVPAQEIAAARLRAIETGRAVVQAAPTGYSAFIDHRGRVQHRSRLGAQQVEVATVERRAGQTVYVRHGDRPVVGLALALVAAAWIVSRGSNRASKGGCGEAENASPQPPMALVLDRPVKYDG